MKKPVRESLVLVLVACAALAGAGASGCVMDSTPEPTPSTGATTSEVDRTLHAPNGAVLVPTPVANDQQIAQGAAAALGPSDNHVNVPLTQVLPRQVSAPGVDDPIGSSADTPTNPHPWDPPPEDPNGNAKPKIGGAEQSSGSTPTTSK